MDSKHCCVELNDGHVIPVLGFGTYASETILKRMITDCTKLATDAGFYHIDAAYLYQSEDEAKLAIQSKIADGTVKREDIFLTSKLWSTYHRQELVQPNLERSLKKFHLDYVDFYLIHFLVSLKNTVWNLAHGSLNNINKNTPVLLNDPVLCNMAKKHKKTPALIALCYQLQGGVVVLAKSFKEHRIKENMQIFEFQLLTEDMKILEGLNINLQYFAAFM